MKKYICAFLAVSLAISLSCPVWAAEEVDQPIIKQVSLGLAIDASGTLWGWGDNSKGELDDIGSGDRLDPWTGPYQTTPIKLMEGVAAVSAGVNTLALKTDGTLWSRGQGEGWSQLLDGVTAIDQGGGNYAAIKKDGSLWLWGDNRFGQLAPGGVKEDHAEEPVNVMSGVKAVSLPHCILETMCLSEVRWYLRPSIPRWQRSPGAHLGAVVPGKWSITIPFPLPTQTRTLILSSGFVIWRPAMFST